MIKRAKANQLKRAALATAACLSAMAAVGRANAEETPYCAKVEARAASDAALLIAPVVRAEGIKLPSALQKGGTIDPSSTAAQDGYQLRAGLTISPLDMYKGFRVMDLAKADCSQQQASVAAQETLKQAGFYGRVPALKQQLAYLDSAKASWEEILAKSTARVEAKVTTIAEADDVRVRISSIERSREQVAGEIARLQASGVDGKRVSVSDLEHRIESSSEQYEDKAAHIRTLDTWDVRITGGYVPPAFGQSSDFFGVIQVSYNLGGFWRNSAEERYQAARREEVKNARYESVEQLRRFREQMKTTAEQAKKEKEVVERRLAVLTSSKKALTSTDAPGAAHALALIELEIISTESERVFLNGLVEELTHVEDKS